MRTRRVERAQMKNSVLAVSSSLAGGKNPATETRKKNTIHSIGSYEDLTIRRCIHRILKIGQLHSVERKVTLLPVAPPLAVGIGHRLMRLPINTDCNRLCSRGFAPNRISLLAL
jgi:hypothetical protein